MTTVVEDSGLAVLRVGERIAGDYEVVAHLNRSNVLDVYDVYSARRDCRCIAKLLCPDRRDDPKASGRLADEGRLLLRMAHPHIVRAYELIERPDPVVILETLTGETLSHMVESSARRLAATDIAFLGMHLCSALHYLHGEGIVHLDVKPSNVVCDNGQAKLLDMSIARPPGPGRRGVGTRQYMSPEQVAGGHYSAATDAWGVAATLFEAATGEAPFPGCDQLERRATPIRELRPRLPAPIADAIDGALDPEPDARPAIRAIADALDSAVPAY
jgi:serine/threonine protein kinase